MEIVLTIITFIIIYLFYLIFVIIRPKKLQKFKDNMYVKYLVNNYNLDLNKVNLKKLANIIAIINSFIIAVVLGIVSITDNILLWVILSIVLLIPFQLISYGIIGKICQKKGMCKNV